MRCLKTRKLGTPRIKKFGAHTLCIQDYEYMENLQGFPKKGEGVLKGQGYGKFSIKSHNFGFVMVLKVTLLKMISGGESG